MKSHYLRFLILISFLQIPSPALIGQNTKRKLLPEDYDLWSELRIQEISDEGKWASYSLNYENGKDTLFIKSTREDIIYSFPEGYNGKFSTGSDYFICQMKEKGVGLLYLSTGAIKWYNDADDYDIAPGGKLLAVSKNISGENDRKKLLLIDLNTRVEKRIDNVSDHLFNDQGSQLAIVLESEKQNSVRLIEFGDQILKPEIIIQDSLNSFKNLLWAPKGEKVAFVREQKGESLKGSADVFIYNIEKNGKLYRLEPESKSDFPHNANLALHNVLTPYIFSRDGEKLFFGVQPELDETILKDSIVQIWHGEDRIFYPEWKTIGNWGNVVKLYMWKPEKEKFTKIGSNKLPRAALTGDQKHALLFNPVAYEPQSKLNADIDLFIVDLISGEKQLIIEKQENRVGFVGVSPTGRYINYFKDRNWWVYDVLKKTHTNITKEFDVPFYDVDYDWSNTAPPYGSPGWTEGDKKIILYDKYDIWLVSPNGKNKEKLTEGRKNEIEYRIAKGFNKEVLPFFYSKFSTGSFDLSECVLLSAHGKNKKSGYFYLTGKGGIREIIYKNMKISNLKIAQSGKALIFTEESYDVSPRLMFWKKGMERPKLLFQSNPQQENFFWGHGELINYKISDGKELQGALLYPANYVKGNIYPMVVEVYESLSGNLHKYVNPTKRMMTGFNPTLYTTNGYFVLYPDISYELDEVGFSAVESVEAAVNEVIERGVVDSDKIGLIGHSFGGYETSFIITQTDLFAAAVAGASITNFPGWYFSIDWNTGKPQFYRFENHQQRFSGTYFENPEAYIANSPVHQAEKVKTPVLLYTGKEDKHVHWFQTIAFHLALNRLGKENVLLVYPGERHVLLERSNQIDLTNRIQNWFDYYLKGDQAKEWITTPQFP